MNEPAWYRHSRDRSERFARAVEHGATHRDDAEFGAELEVVSSLRRLGAQPTVDTGARDRMRARILAEAAASQTAATPARTITQRPTSRRRAHAGILAAATAAGFVGFGLLGIQLSQDALPGDFLYNIKRTGEDLSLDLTFTDSARAFKHLELASTRVRELEALVARYDAAGDGSSADPAVYRSLLNDLDKEASQGSQAVTLLATQSDGAALRVLAGWAAEHTERMNAIKAGIPSDVVGRFEASVDLLEQIGRRAGALTDRMSCYQITSGTIDQLGVQPADVPCAAAPASYPLMKMFAGDLGQAGGTPAPAAPGGQVEAVPDTPSTPVVEPGPARAPDPGLSTDVTDVETPDEVNDGIDPRDPRSHEPLTAEPPTVPTSGSMFPGLPTVDLP